MQKKYLEVYESTRRAILEGAYRKGEKLPSKRVMAERTGVSLITVEHAYDLLAAEGYIEPMPRSGYFVAYGAGELFGAPNSEVPVPPMPAGDTGAGEFPFSVYAGTVRSLLSVYGEKLLARSPNSGIDVLKSAICRYLRRNRGIDVAENRIVVGSGAEYLYGLIIELLGRDRVFGIEDPSYQKIRNVYESRGVTCEPLPLGRDGITAQALENARARVLHVTPYRSYPTGVSATVSKKLAYLQWAAERGGVIVEDDYESEFSVAAKPAETIFAHDRHDRVIYLNTFSQTISPALRVGYMILPEHLVKTFETRLGFYACSVPVLEQYLIAALLDNGSFERHINRVRRARRREIDKK